MSATVMGEHDPAVGGNGFPRVVRARRPKGWRGRPGRRVGDGAGKTRDMSRGALWTGVVAGLAVGMLAAAVPHALVWRSEGLDVAMATVALWAALRLASDREGPWWMSGVLALVLVSLGVAAYGLEEVPRYSRPGAGPGGGGAAGGGRRRLRVGPPP